MITKTKYEVCVEILHTLAEKLNMQIQSFDFDGCVCLKPVDIAPNYYSKELKASKDIELTSLYHEGFEKLRDDKLFDLHFDPRLGAFDAMFISSGQAKRIYGKADMFPRFVISEKIHAAFFKYDGHCSREVQSFINRAKETNFRGFRHVLPKPYVRRVIKDREVCAEDFEEYWDNVLKGADAIIGLGNDVLVKNLSKQLYGDSKLLEHVYAADIVKVIDPELCSEKVSVKDILAKHRVFAVEPLVMLRGSATIAFADGNTVDLSGYKAAIGFSPEQINSITMCSCKHILTIENPTTFQSLPKEQDTVFINTYGQAKDAAIQLINNLVDCSGVDVVEHFGDLDPAGFDIAKSVAVKLKSAVLKLRWMDSESLPHYTGVIKMAGWQKMKFKKMLSDPFFSEKTKNLFQELIDKNIVAEQEGFRLPGMQ